MIELSCNPVVVFIRVALVVTALALTACGERTIVETPPSPPPDTTAPGDAVSKTKPPLLVVTSPERGAWFKADVPVTISGTVTETTAPITAVKVNSQPISFTPPNLNHVIEPIAGVNIVDLRVEAADGARSVDGRAFFSGDVHPIGTSIPSAIHVHLSPAFLDDNEPDLDDMAGLFEMLLTDTSFLSLVNDPVDSAYATLTPTGLSAAGASVDLTPQNNELALTIVLTNVHATFDMDGKGELDEILTGPAEVNASEATIVVYLTLSTAAGKISSEATYVDVSLTGFSAQMPQYPNLAVDYPTISAAIVEFVQAKMEDTLQVQAAQLLGGLVADLLEEFALSMTIGEDPPITINLNLESISVAHHGMSMTLGANVTGPLDSHPALSLAKAGSLATTHTAIKADFSTAPVAFAFDDDLINRFLFAFWRAGAFTGTEVVGDQLEELGFNKLPQVFQPLSRVVVDGLLPLTVTPALAAVSDDPLTLSMGEINLSLTTTDNRTFDVSLNVRTGLTLALADESTKELQVVLNTDPAAMLVAIGCTAAPPGIDPGDVSALIRVGIPPILQSALSGFAFPLPSFDMAKLIDADSMQNKVLYFEEITVTTDSAGGHYLVLEGRSQVK